MKRFLKVLVFLMISQVPAVNPEVKVVGHKPIYTKVGDDVILPCHLEPRSELFLDVNSLTIKWRFKDQIIHVYHNGAKDDKTSDPMYEGRTSLFHDEFKKGNISLKLNNVSKEDGGIYTCFVPDLQSKEREGNVTLYVGEVVGHEPIQAEVGNDVTLPCHLDPPFDVNSLTIEWRFKGKEILVRESKAEKDETPDPKYQGRISLFHDEFKKGNISLKLTNVTKEDEGIYTCIVPKLQPQVRKGNVTLKLDENVAPDNVIDPRGEVVGHEPIHAKVGDDVILPCHLKPQSDVNKFTIEWRFQGQIILVRQSQAKNDETSAPKYKNRTFMFHDEFKDGNISLKLTNVNKEDEGIYTCFVIDLQSKVRKGNVTLYVGTDYNELVLALALGLGIPAIIIIIIIIIISVCYLQRRQNGIENDNPPADNGVL